MYDIPIDYLVSPVSKRSLTLKNEWTLSDGEGNEFPRHPRFGFWNFVPKESPLYNEAQWKTWEKLIENFEVSYKEDPTHNVSLDERPDALAFGEFCDYQGRVLDLGSGPHRVPSYVKYRRKTDVEYYGLDPFVGEHPKEYVFVQGVGEHVPFRDQLFDRTLYATSLHHFIDPRVGIREAIRVTKNDGSLCVWVGDKAKDAPKPSASNAWYEKLEVPSGAENPFHYHRFSSIEFEGYVRDCDLRVKEKAIVKIDEWRASVFFRVTR